MSCQNIVMPVIIVKIKKTEPDKYKKFTATHKCNINHIGIAGLMEASDLKECFMTSAKTSKFRYTRYTGDGHSESFKNIYRSSRPEVFLRKGVLKICSTFTGEHPCRSVISIKLLCTLQVLLLGYYSDKVPYC